MEKITTINLGGFAFTIEEVAYHNLKDYLESVRKKIGSDVDKNEVMTDIEMSIAEKLKEKTKQGKNIVTEKDVDELITIMGHPDDFEDSKNEKIDSDVKINKKLFRDTENSILGGVCSGLATYFDVELVLVRLAAFLLVFCNGIGIPAYILLWIIIPAAETKAQKLEMQGSPLTVAAIEKSFKESDNEKKTGYKKILSNIGKIFKRLLSISFKIFLFLINFSIIAATLLTIIGMTILVFVLIMYASSGYAIDNILISEIVKVMPFYLFLGSLFFAVVIPAFFLFAADIMIAFKRKILNMPVVIVLIVLWMIASIITATITIRYAPDIREKMNDIQYRQTIEIPSLENFNSISTNGRDLIISVSKGDKFSVSANGMKNDLDRVSYNVDEEKVLNISISEKVRDQKCLFCNSKIVRIAITTPNIETIKINGSDLNINKIVADKISIETSGSDYVTVNGTINTLDFKTNSTQSSITGDINNLNIIAEDSNVSIDINSENETLKLENTTLSLSGYAEKTFLDANKDSKINGLEFQTYDADIKLKKDSWLITRFENSMLTEIDETSGMFYMGEAKIKKSNNSPFATFSKITKITPYEYRKNLNEDNYFEFYGNAYRLDITNGSPEVFYEKRQLLVEKF
ncbi:PspC domain-containing protein [bacterium]|nr:PspC domain-containing protein [bacterium]